MKVINQELLRQFARAGRCELCGSSCKHCHAHHLLARGMGGGGRVDIPENLLALCPPCHRKTHDGHVKLEVLVKLVGERMGLAPDVVLERIWEIRRRRK